MSRLVTFGCSLTYGQHLNDRHSESWPAQLSNKLDLFCDNQAVNGASNKHIWWKIVNYNFIKSDVVCVLWSHLDRWCVIKHDDITVINQWETDKNVIAKEFYTHLHNDFDMTTQSLLMMNHTKMYLDTLGVKQIHMIAKPMDTDFAWNTCDIAPIDMSIIRKKYPLANDNHHPGPQAHKEFAKQIYRYYTKEINE